MIKLGSGRLGSWEAGIRIDGDATVSVSQRQGVVSRIISFLIIILLSTCCLYLQTHPHPISPVFPSCTSWSK